MRKLRHTATSWEQEYRRDVEMREAVKAAEERALRAWRDSRPHFPFAKEVHQQPKAWEREHGSLWDLKTATRAAARAAQDPSVSSSAVAAA
jgi:hypothetical protein